jgi:hypothetical protein
MFKHIIAATTLIACTGTFAADTATSTTPAKPAGGEAGAVSSTHTHRDPPMFAKHKDALIAQRTKTDTCIKAATDTKNIMECLKAEHEAMKAAHPRHQEGRGEAKGPSTAPVPAPAK